MLKNKSLRVRLHATPIYCQQPGASKQEVGVEFQMAFPLQAWEWKQNTLDFIFHIHVCALEDSSILSVMMREMLTCFQ